MSDAFFQLEIDGCDVAWAVSRVQGRERLDAPFRFRVHAKPVDVALLDPEERVRDQEIPHLFSAVVENVGSPIGVFAFARIGVFVKRSSVESPERPEDVREVPGHARLRRPVARLAGAREGHLVLGARFLEASLGPVDVREVAHETSFEEPIVGSACRIGGSLVAVPGVVVLGQRQVQIPEGGERQ